MTDARGQSSRETQRKRIARHALNVLVLFALTWLTFGQSLDYEFVWDDVGLIVKNEAIRQPDAWSRLMLRSFWQVGRNTDDPNRSFYRPVISLSYLTDYNLWGLNARGFHLTNVLAHGAAAALLYWLMFLLLASRPAALLTAGLWSCHPTHVENVCWVAGRTDVICGVFYFLAFALVLLYLRGPQTRPRMVLPGIAVAYALALFSKEMAVSLPILVLVYGLAVVRRDRSIAGRLVIVLTLLAGLTVLYLAVRLAVLGKVAAPPAFGTVASRLRSVPVVVARYIGLVLNVVAIDPHHADPLVETVGDPRFVLATAVVLACGFGVLAVRRSASTAMLFLLCWFPATLIPVLNLGTFGDILYADRSLYIPSAGLLAALVAIARGGPWGKPQARQWTRIMAIGLSCTAAAAFVMLAKTNGRHWKNNTALFGRAAQTSPQSAYVLFNLGNSLADEGRHEAALAAYAKTLQLAPWYVQARTNMGAVLVRMRQYQAAIVQLEEALALGERSAVLLTNLGHAYRASGDLPSAEARYRQSLESEETDAAHNNLGECLLAMQRPGEAFRHFSRAAALRPSAATCNNLGLLHFEQGRPEEALPHLERALPLALETGNPAEEAKVRYNLARALHALGRHPEAAVHARRSLRLIEGETDPLATTDAVVGRLRDIADGHSNNPGAETKTE